MNDQIDPIQGLEGMTNAEAAAHLEERADFLDCALLAPSMRSDWLRAEAKRLREVA